VPDAVCRSRPASADFIVINIDDHSNAHIGPFGSKLNRTPNLDCMANEGRKRNCFHAAPVSSPSRSALMTGCHPKRVLTIPGVLFPAGAADAKSPHEVFCYYRGLKLEAVHSGPWKLRFAAADKSAAKKTKAEPPVSGDQLYNLADGIAEAKDVSGANPGIVRRHRALADATKDD
jgi:hypothetical protein